MFIPQTKCVCIAEMPKLVAKGKTAVFSNKGSSQGHKGVICKGSISSVCIPNVKSPSLEFQNLWPRLIFFFYRQAKD